MSNAMQHRKRQERAQKGAGIIYMQKAGRNVSVHGQKAKHVTVLFTEVGA
jgi:hypothetical protein